MAHRLPHTSILNKRNTSHKITQDSTEYYDNTYTT